MEPLRPLAALLDDPLALSLLRRVQVVATDVDGTLTSRGKFGVELIEALMELAARGIRVLPVSGRCAGEVLGLVRYLPGVTAGIAENGLLVLVADAAPVHLLPDADQGVLRRAGERLNAEYDANLRLAPDEMFRLGDLAFEREGRDETELERLRVAAHHIGVHLVWSSVHVHLAPAPPDKGLAVQTWARHENIDPERILTIGDAPNDAGLFAPDRFALTIGTADVAPQKAHFPYLPQFVTAGREAAGFLEMTRTLLGAAHG